jgi:hypothetical protein
LFHALLHLQVQQYPVKPTPIKPVPWFDHAEMLCTFDDFTNDICWVIQFPASIDAHEGDISWPVQAGIAVQLNPKLW